MFKHCDYIAITNINSYVVTQCT